MIETLAQMRQKHARLLDESLREIVATLSKMEDVRRISVFGSYAQGHIDLFTDLDLLVIMQTDKGPLERLRTLYTQMAASVDVDILCYTPQEFETLKERGFLKETLRSERVLYAK